MVDAYPEYNLSQNETTPAVPTLVSAPVKQSMGAVEIGVIAIALAITILTASAAISLSRRR